MKGDGNYDRVEASDEGQRGDDDVEEGQSWNFSRPSVDEVNEHELKRWRGDERVERKKGRKETAWKKRTGGGWFRGIASKSRIGPIFSLFKVEN